jgi:hypothetical protein
MKKMYQWKNAALCGLALAVGGGAWVMENVVHADSQYTVFDEMAFPLEMANHPARGQRLEQPYTVLSQAELEILNHKAMQMEAMMDAILPMATLVWPHAVRDAQGRVGLFMAPTVAFSDLARGPNDEHLVGWVVCAVIAAGKYAEVSEVRIDHICFTDPTGMRGDLWCYDVEMAMIRQLHRRLATGQMGPEEAYQLIAEHWQKITRDS